MISNIGTDLIKENFERENNALRGRLVENTKD